MSNLVQTIKSTEKSFDSKAKQTGLLFETEALFAMQMLEKNSMATNVALTNPKSVKEAMLNVAAIGLSLNPANADVYLVPRDKAICLDISYRGLIKLAINTGAIRWVQADVVYTDDDFVMGGPGDKPSHTFDPFKKDRGDAVGAYCVAKTIDGDFLTTVMSADEINEIRSMSKSATGKRPEYSPWNTFPAEMWKKTVIKRAAKTWPYPDKDKAEILHNAISVINEHEGLAHLARASNEQIDYFKRLLDTEDLASAYAFQQGLEIEIRTDLISTYVSRNAPDRQKMKFKAWVNEQLAKGREIVDGYITDLIDVANDEYGIREIVAEVNMEVLDFIIPELPIEIQETINQLDTAA